MIATALAIVAVTAALAAQRGRGMTPEQAQRRWDLERELQSIAVVERKLMLPTRDGIRLATDIYRPNNATGKVPTIFVKTPYNFNYRDVRNAVPPPPAVMADVIGFVKRGYAVVYQNERGHFFSEGNYDILGPPTTDGYDTIEWLSKQPWSNGRVGAFGCSSTAEWQPAVAALGHPGFAAMHVRGFGGGIGKVGPYWEQGLFYRGGAVQMFVISWLYAQQNQVRPMFPPNTSQEDLIAASRLFDLAPQMPPVDWSQALRHLPVEDILENVNAPRGIFADAMPVASGGRMIQRTPNDPAWHKGGLWHDTMPLNVPGLWFMSWYDISVGPNIEVYNHVRKTARKDIADQQWMIIAPLLHCQFRNSSANTVVGERSMGDTRFEYDEIMNSFYARFLKGENSGRLDTLPKVTYFTMGSNRWQSSDTWPPAGAQPLTLYLASQGRANTLHGDGALAATPPQADRPDSFTYDPMNPVPSYGGGICCIGDAITGGSFDQRKIEERDDVLVYTSEPFRDGVEVTGPITPTLYVSSDAKDTDITVKVLDVYPDGRAYNLEESIQRLRYREGYAGAPVFMEKGKVYKVTLQPLTTSNFFAPGHQIRIEVSSSNFPRFDRNLNTGGNNYDESKPVVARNAIHHSKQYPSSVTFTVVTKSGSKE